MCLTFFNSWLKHCIIDLHDLHNHSFLTSLFLTEVHHYACAVNISRLSHGCDDGIPRELPGDTTLFSTVARDARGSRRKRPWRKRMLPRSDSSRGPWVINLFKMAKTRWLLEGHLDTHVNTHGCVSGNMR